MSVSLIVILIASYFIGGAIFYKKKFPEASDSIIFNDILLTPSGFVYNSNHELTVSIIANTTSFPEIDATYLYFIPMNTRLFWSWRDFMEFDLVFNREYLAPPLGMRHDYVGARLFPYEGEEIMEMEFELIIKLIAFDGETFHLKIIKE